MGGEGRGGRRKEGRGSLSGNVAKEAFCLKSAFVTDAIVECTVSHCRTGINVPAMRNIPVTLMLFITTLVRKNIYISVVILRF